MQRGPGTAASEYEDWAGGHGGGSVTPMQGQGQGPEPLPESAGGLRSLGGQAQLWLHLAGGRDFLSARPPSPGAPQRLEVGTSPPGPPFRLRGLASQRGCVGGRTARPSREPPTRGPDSTLNRALA